MNSILLNSILSAGAISLLSLVGVITLGIKDSVIKKLSLFLVAFSTGALLGGAFLHLLPEATTNNGDIKPYLMLLAGIILFYLLERFLKWHHCHKDGVCEVHTYTYMSIVGDSLHNLIDGLVIVSSFSINNQVGVAATIAIASHELPQEIGDFGILIHGGFSKMKALIWNLISSLTAIAGVFLGYLLINNIENMSAMLLPFAAGGFIYISMSDLIPELHKENNTAKSLYTFLIFILGLAFMYFIKIYFE